MRSIVLACALLSSGCFNYRSSQITAATGGVLLVGGITIAVVESHSGSSNEETDDHAINGREALAGLLVTLGLVTVIAGIGGMVVHRQ